MGEKKKKRVIKILAERLTPGLTETERKFLNAAELGDESAVKVILEKESVSPDCADTQGRTALDLAIISGHENLVNYLFGLVSSKKIHQGLLCAVESDRTEICEILLRHPMYRRRTVESEVQLYIDEDAEEASNGTNANNKTPNDMNVAEEYQGGKKRKGSVQIYAKVDKMLREALMRAAIKNNFQIVQMIMLRAVSLEVPHDYFCSCDQCISDRLGDYMVFCNNRLDTFRALASPSYIVLTEEDPIVACFHLSQRFQRLKIIETENQKTYDELNNQCQDFTLSLLDQCRTSEEVKTVLSGSNTTTSFSDDEDEFEEKDDDNFPLLSLAMRMDQKKFVAHSKCQAQVSELWFSGLQLLRHLNRFEFLLLSIPIGIILLPLLSIVYVVAPWSKVTNLLNTPLTRFLSYMCSYLTFLTVIVLCKLHFNGLWLTLGCNETPLHVYALVVLVFMWITGWIWEEMKQLYNAGASDYFLSLWNIVDSLMLTFLLSSFTLDVIIPLRMKTILKTQSLSLNNSGLPSFPNLTMMPLCYTFPFISTSLQEVCFAPTLVMKAHWSPEWVPDPELLSDVMFSAGIVLSVSRISFIMPVNETFGTMLVSFRRTFGDLVKLFAMFLVILLSFTCGIAALYAAHICQTEFFQGNSIFGGTFFLLVWSLLGFGPSEAPILKDDQPMSSLTHNPSRNPVVQWLGYLLYGIYVFAALTVLMNLLIAVMSNTFQEVQDERDIEWKFARTELWLTFIEPGCCVAPPFNVIPTPKDICHLMQLIRRFFRRCFRIIKRKPLYTKETERVKQAEEEMEIQRKKNAVRQDVMCTLVRRYILQAVREKLEEGDDAEDKLRRLIERIAAKLEDKINELNRDVREVDEHVNFVQRGGMDIRTMQKSEIDLTQTLINTHDEYLRMVNTIWEDSKNFREKKVKIIQEMREERRALLADGKVEDAQRMEDAITDLLEDADFVPRTTIF